MKNKSIITIFILSIGLLGATIFLGDIQVTFGQTKTVDDKTENGLHSYSKAKYGLFSRIKAKKGKQKELLSILLKASQFVSEVDGCDYYIVSSDQDDETSVLIYEVWQSKEAHANSLKLASVRKLIGKALPMLDGSPERIATFDVVGGKGVKF